MQVDSQKVAQSPQFINYFDVNNNFAWRQTRSTEIKQRRALLSDTLIFDLLLSHGGIQKPDALYPPTDVSALRQLLDAIEASQYDTLKKECLVYYLLKWHQDGREGRFQLDRCIPPHFTALADAYWSLDTGADVALAVSLLADVRLNQEYVSKVLQAIFLASDPTLIVKYVRTASPSLTEPCDLDLYVVALAECCGLCDAWEYQRTFNQTSPLRSRLFKKLLVWSVTPKPKPAALKQLLFLPLIPFEESLLRSFALEPSSSLPPAATAALQDLICIRLIQAGRYTEAIKTDHEFVASTSSLLKGLTSERSKMIQELYTTLPAAERLLLDEELKQTNKELPPPPSPRNMSTSWSGDLSVSSSWEDVRKMLSPPPHGKRAHMKGLARDAQLSPKSFAERAARFGGSIPRKSLADIHLPLIPTSNVLPKLVQRKSFPLPHIPATKPPAKTTEHIPVSTLDVSRGPPTARPSTERHVSPLNSLPSPGPSFSSANRSKNAFYEPPPSPKGLDVARVGNHVAEPESPVAGPSNDDIDADMADANAEQNQDAENPPELEYSIFGDDASVSQEVGISNGYRPMSDQEKRRRNVPPGAFLLDEEDGIEDEDAWEKTTVHAQPALSRPERSRQAPAASENKPEPAAEKKSARPRYSTTREVEQLKRSLPGSLMDDEDEEEDDVAPLKQPSPPRRLRKRRSSISSDYGDEPEAPQTRRRSSRLSSQLNVTVEESPRKASASTRTKKSTKPLTSSTKKRR